MFHGLQVDFEYRHGHYMVLTDPAGLTDDQLSPLQVNMLRANDIPCLLPLIAEELDGQVKLYFNITGKKMLSPFLRQNKLAFSEYIQLMLKMAAVLDNSKTYMLLETHYALQTDLLFYGADPTDIYFTYVPLERLAKERPIHDDFRQLAAQLLRSVEAADDPGIQPVMSYLLGESFHIAGFKKMLLRQLREAKPQPPAVESLPLLPADHWSVRPTPESASPHEGRRAEQDGAWVQASEPLQPTEEAVWPAAADTGAHGRTRKLTAPVLAAAALLCAMIWKWYADHPAEPALYMAAGLSLLVAGAAFFTLRIWRPGSGAGNGTPEEMGALPGLNAAMAETSSVSFAMPLERFEPAAAAPPPYRNGNAGDASPEPNATGYLASADATVWLGDMSQTAARAVLERNRAGAPERIPLYGDSFIIGRSGPGVHYAEDNAEISRVHAEFLQADGHFMVKDLGSKNGSSLNGEPMVPYRVYSLKEGDIVKLVKTEFTFKMGS